MKTPWKKNYLRIAIPKQFVNAFVMCVHLYFSLCDIKRQKHAYGIYFLKPCESNIINLSPWFKTLNLDIYLYKGQGGGGGW